MPEENNVQSTEVSPQNQAGSVISPGGAVVQPPSAAPQPDNPPQATVITSSEVPEAATAVSAEPSAAATDQSDGSISWTASEFIAHHKSAGWYGLLALAAIILAAIVFLLTRDVISTVVVIVGAIVLGGYGARQPRQLSYRLDAQGVTIGEKHFQYEAFRSFAIVPEGAFSSIIFTPLKRFAPWTTIYYAPADEDRIIELLQPQLPLEEHVHDPIDRLMRQIRF